MNAIAEDQDEIVVELTLDANEQIKNERRLGHLTHPPTDFGCLNMIPREQALIRLQKVSRADENWKNWVAVTVGFPKPESGKERDAEQANKFVYVFRQSKKCIGILKESYPEVEQLIIDDLNGNGFDYLFVKYNEDSRTYSPWMSIWQFGANGTIRPIPLKTLEEGLKHEGKLEVTIVNDRVHQASLLTEEKVAVGSGRWQKLSKSYRWDAMSGQYKLSGQSKTEETSVSAE